nr:DUF2388 domain-containing protein [Pseudomonas sp. MWU13-2517]
MAIRVQLSTVWCISRGAILARHASSSPRADPRRSIPDSLLTIPGKAARDDAESFAATDGQIRGVRLEAALVHIYERLPGQTFTDMQLAQAIDVR